MKKPLNKNKPFIPVTKAGKQVVTPASAPQGQAPTLGQLINEAKARCRRLNSDQLYLDNVIDTLYQEIDVREGRIMEIQARLDKYEKKPETESRRGVH